MYRNKKSFTLIELLVVIAIIAILAAMLLPALQQARARATSSKCVGNLKQMGVIAQQYMDDHQGFWATPQNTKHTYIYGLWLGKYLGGGPSGSMDKATIFKTGFFEWYRENYNSFQAATCPAVPVDPSLYTPTTFRPQVYGAPYNHNNPSAANPFGKIGYYPGSPAFTMGYKMGGSGVVSESVGPSQRVLIMDGVGKHNDDNLVMGALLAGTSSDATDPKGGTANGTGGYSRPCEVHNGRMNLLMFGGNVTSADLSTASSTLYVPHFSKISGSAILQSCLIKSGYDTDGIWRVY